MSLCCIALIVSADSPLPAPRDSAARLLPTASCRDFGGRRRFHGQAVTVKCFESNVLISQLLDTPGQGRVLVADAGGSLR